MAATALADLSSLKPPSDAAHDNAVLVKAMRLIIAGLERERSEMGTGNYTGARQTAASIFRERDVRAVTPVLQDLRSKGYLGTR
jgi:hypothetical protein